MVNYYDKLGLDSKLSDSDLTKVITNIRDQWTRQTQSEDLSERIEAEKKLPLINKAYDTLANPTARAEYDRQISTTGAMDSQTVDAKYIEQLSDDIRELLRQENYSDALLLAERLTEVNPDEPVSWLRIADVQKNMKQYEKAIEHYQKATDVDPTNVDAYVGLGYCYTKLNQFDPSMRYYTRALELDDESMDAHAGYAHLQQFVGNYNESIKHYEKVVEIVGAYPVVLLERIAHVYFKKGESFLPHDTEDESYYYYIGEEEIKSFIHYVEKADSIHSTPKYQDEIKKAKKSLAKTYDWGKITLLTLPLFFIDMMLIIPFGVFMGILYLSFRPRWVIFNRKQFGNKTLFDYASGIYTKKVGAIIIFAITLGLSLGGVATFSPAKYKD